MDPQVELWALDEVHFQQYGSRCRMWVAPEIKDPILMHAPVRHKVGYFGAVRLRDGKFLHAREENRFDAASFWNFLKMLRSRTSRCAKKLVIISDNARYHHGILHKTWREECADRFALDFLPPYSPELNPTERIWKLTRRLCIHNEYFACITEVSDRVEGQFHRWANGNETLRKLCGII